MAGMDGEVSLPRFPCPVRSARALLCLGERAAAGAAGGGVPAVLECGVAAYGARPLDRVERWGTGDRRQLLLPVVLVEDAGDGIALDELSLFTGGVAERRGGDAIDIAQRPGGGFVEHGEGVVRAREHAPRSPSTAFHHSHHSAIGRPSGTLI